MKTYDVVFKVRVKAIDEEDAKLRAMGEIVKSSLHLESYDVCIQEVEGRIGRNEKVKCPICGKEFENTRALGSHLHYIHGISREHKREGANETERILEEFEKT